MTERHEDSQNFIFFFSDGGEVYLPPASLVADLYDNGSGAPNISALTIEAFGFGEPGAANFSVDQLGKVETGRSEEHTSELQSLMRISYAVFCLKKKTHNK